MFRTITQAFFKYSILKDLKPKYNKEKAIKEGGYRRENNMTDANGTSYILNNNQKLKH